jgi:hypothetical protein
MWILINGIRQYPLLGNKVTSSIVNCLWVHLSKRACPLATAQSPLSSAHILSLIPPSPSADVPNPKSDPSNVGATVVRRVVTTPNEWVQMASFAWQQAWPLVVSFCVVYGMERYRKEESRGNGNVGFWWIQWCQVLGLITRNFHLHCDTVPCIWRFLSHEISPLLSFIFLVLKYYSPYSKSPLRQFWFSR